MESKLNPSARRAVVVALTLLSAALPACQERKSSTSMQHATPDQKALRARVEALPEIELPDAWYLVPAEVALPERWTRVAAMENGGPRPDELAARFANGGAPFKHSVYSNMPGPKGVSVTIVAPRDDRFVQVTGVELEAMSVGTLAPARAAEIARVVDAR